MVFCPKQSPTFPQKKSPKTSHTAFLTFEHYVSRWWNFKDILEFSPQNLGETHLSHEKTPYSFPLYWLFW